MKRYGTLFLFPFLLIISLSVFSGFGYQTDQETVKRLLTERTSILQQAYYGHIGRDDAEQRLARIETQPLLSEDILSLRETEDTEVDTVSHMEILTIRQVKKLYRYLTYQSRISWYMNGLQGSYTETLDYHVVLKQIGQGYKISELNPVTSL